MYIMSTRFTSSFIIDRKKQREKAGKLIRVLNNQMIEEEVLKLTCLKVKNINKVFTFFAKSLAATGNKEEDSDV